jgi:N-methylhydantoinase A/oxoprolinase/acetone carboxylase beta subunit
MGVRLGIVTGGTFTDLIGIDEVTGELVVAKTPSTPSRVEAGREARGCVPRDRWHRDAHLSSG